MTQYTYDDDDEFGGNENEPDLVKDLRKQLKAEKKARTEAENKVSETSKSLNEFRLRDVLSERGISDQRVAKFIQKDEIDLSDSSAVDAWLEQNGDLFGYAKEDESQSNQRDAATVAQMNQAESAGVSAGGAQDSLTQAIKSTKSPEELTALIQQNMARKR